LVAERRVPRREALTFPDWCVFTTWLELILSEIPDRNQTKEAAPPPLANVRQPAKKFSLLFFCARRIFPSKRGRKLFCWLLPLTMQAAGLAFIFCKGKAEFPPHPPSALPLLGRTEIFAAAII